MNRSRLTDIPWQHFVTRPATLLERDLRFGGYFLAGLRHILVISDSGLSEVFVHSDEWKSFEKKYEKFYLRGKIDSIFKILTAELIEIQRRLKQGKIFEPQNLINHYTRLCRTVIIAHYLMTQTIDNRSCGAGPKI